MGDEQNKAVEAYKARNAAIGWTGRSYSFDDGILFLDREGNGSLLFDDELLDYEPPDSESRKTYRSTTIAASEMVALRDYLAGAFPPNPAIFPAQESAEVARLLRLYAGANDEAGLRAVLSNNLNTILAALDAASRPKATT